MEQQRNVNAEFREIFGRYAEPIYREVHERSGSHETAKRVTARVFEEAYAALLARCSDVHFEQWIYNRAEHHLMDETVGGLCDDLERQSDRALALAGGQTRIGARTNRNMPPEEAAHGQQPVCEADRQDMESTAVDKGQMEAATAVTAEALPRSAGRKVVKAKRRGRWVVALLGVLVAGWAVLGILWSMKLVNIADMGFSWWEQNVVPLVALLKAQ